VPYSGNNGNKSYAPHNDGVEAVTDIGNKTPSEDDLLPVDQTVSSASTPGGRHIVTDVTDREQVEGREGQPTEQPSLSPFNGVERQLELDEMDRYYASKEWSF
jgi:hypothetical protein